MDEKKNVRKAAISKAQRKRPLPTDSVDYEKWVRSDAAKFDPNVDMEIVNPNLGALKKKRGPSPSPQSKPERTKPERFRQVAERFGKIDKRREELDDQYYSAAFEKSALENYKPDKALNRKLDEAYEASKRQFQKDFGADVPYNPAQAKRIYKAYQTMDDKADIDRVVSPLLESLRSGSYFRRKRENN